MKLSIIIPVYNESKTLKELLKRIGKVGLEKVQKEIIIVDDCSTDGSRDIVKNLDGKYIKVLLNRIRARALH